MSPQPRGLGRGLGALIPSSDAGMRIAADIDRPKSISVVIVPIADISPNPRQPRAAIPPETLAELAASIREHGVIQPLIVTRGRPGDRAAYQLIAGERRWRAAQLAGLAEVPIIVKEATPQQFLELALVENLQRADLNPLEEAAAYQALMDDFGLSQHQVAERVGRSRTAIANSVRLLRLPDQVKALLAEESLSEGHARALLGLPDSEMICRAAEQAVARELNVRQTEELVRRLSAAAQGAEAPADEDRHTGQSDETQTRQLEDAFRNTLGTRVSLVRGRRGGKLVIYFYSDEELQTIYEHVVGGH